MFEQLENALNVPTPEKQKLLRQVALLMAHQYQTACNALAIGNNDLAEILAHHIFDTLDWVRKRFGNPAVRSMTLDMPCGLQFQSSLPAPQNLDELEQYTTEYLVKLSNSEVPFHEKMLDLLVKF